MRAKSWVSEPEPEAEVTEDPFELAARAFEQVSVPVSEFYDDPVGFIEEFVDFGIPAKGTKAGMTDYQEEILRALVAKKRMAVRGPHGLGKCLRYDEPMRLADGTLVPAQKLLGSTFRVQAVDPVSGELREMDAHAWDNGVQPTVRITTDKGRTVTRTLNHPFWADVAPKGHSSPQGRGRVRPEGSWVPAGDLRVDSTVAVYAGNAGAVGVMGRDELTVLAGLVADGGVTGPSSVIYTSDTGPMLDEFTAAVEHLGSKIRHVSRYDYRVTGVEWHNNTVLNLSREHGLQGHSAREKRLPEIVWGLDTEHLAFFVNRLWAGDGWVTAGPREDGRVNRELGYTTVNPLLAEDLQRALLRLGVNAEVRRTKTKWTHLGEERRGIAWTVAVHEVREIEKFAKVVGPPLGKERQFAALLATCADADWRRLQRWRSHKLPDGYHWEKVKSVEVLEPEPTVAITVPGWHTFVTDFVEHNTTMNALAVLWFAITRDDAGVDWKVATTAGAWRQLEKYLWPEIRKWAKRLRWSKLGITPWRDGVEMMTLSLSLEHGEAFAVASSDPKKIEGVHADAVLYIFDESKAIAADTFDAAEGAFSGATVEDEDGEEAEGRSLEALALAASTPGETVGRFYEIHQRKAGLEDWSTRHVTLKEVIRAGRVARNWADARRRQWGADSAMYANRVLGEFHSSPADVTIPLSWVEAANERWLEWKERGRRRHSTVSVYGVDVARGERDMTAIAERCGDVVIEVTEYPTAETTRVNDLIKEALGPGDVAMIDVVGVGGPVFDQARKDGFNVRPFTASGKSYLRDVSGMLGFLNRRAEMWWRMREALNPDTFPKIAIPPNADLISELTAPRWSVTEGNKIQIEGKKELKKRLGRSTDNADAMLQTFVAPDSQDERSADRALGQRTVAHMYGVPSDISAFTPGGGHTARDGDALAYGSGGSESFYAFGSD